MWCPPDYHHIHEVEELCESVAAELVPRERGKELIFLDKENHEIDHERSNESRRLVVAGTLFELFVYEYSWNAFACSSTGQILRLSRYVVRPVNFNHLTQYSKRFSRRIELLYVDIGSGKIDPFGTAARIVDWTELDDSSDHGMAWQNNAVKDFGELTGWTVCYPRNEIDLSKARLLDLWHRRFPPEETKQRGRPREQEAVKAAYQKAFPNGHGALTQKQVLKTLSDQGQDTSIDTLRRALGARD